MKACHETRPGALVEDKYAMALKQKDVTVRHLPKLLSKLTFLPLTWRRSSGENNRKKKQFSKDLPQGGVELLALYVFKTTNLAMHSNLPGLISDAIKPFNIVKDIRDKE